MVAPWPQQGQLEQHHRPPDDPQLRQGPHHDVTPPCGQPDQWDPGQPHGPPQQRDPDPHHDPGPPIDPPSSYGNDDQDHDEVQSLSAVVVTRASHQLVATVNNHNGSAIVMQHGDYDSAPDDDAESSGTVSDHAGLQEAAEHVHAQMQHNGNSLRVVPVIIDTLFGQMVKNALLDDGSTITMISHELAQRYDLQGKAVVTEVITAGNKSITHYGIQAKLKVHDMKGKFIKTITAHTLPNVLQDVMIVDWRVQKDNWPHLADINFPKFQHTEVGLLIGAPDADIMASIREVRGPEGSPVARKTRLGWTVLGPVCPPSPGGVAYSTEATHVIAKVRLAVQEAIQGVSDKVATKDPYAIQKRLHSAPQIHIDHELVKLCQWMWRTEENGFDSELQPSPQEKRVLDSLRNGIKYLPLPDGNFNIQLPTTWLLGEPNLSNNRQYALSRQLSQERNKKFNHSAVKEEYVCVMREHQALGYVRKLPPDEEQEPTVYYIPHFPVLNSQKESTPYQALQDEKIATKYPQLQWKFSPPGGPWHTALAERTVQSVKQALNNLVGPGELDPEQFTTALIMAEGVLNSRPLTYVSNDLDDLLPLTPNHFIPGALLRDLGPYAQGILNLEQRFKQVDEALDRFWQRFLNELTPQVHQLNSLLKGSPNLAVGDVVAVLDKGTRGHWPLGLITKVFPNQDEKVRQVQLYVEKQYLIRPVSRLMLPVKKD